LEIGSFVNSKLILQLADTDTLFKLLPQGSETAFSVLIANQQGLERALNWKVSHLALFTAASEAFCHKNINCSVLQSIQRFKYLISQARKSIPVHIRGYISCAWDCPFSGSVEIDRVVELVGQLKNIGCDEIILADTTGKANPAAVELLLEACSNDIDKENIALHFHNNFGMALANIVASLQLGISIFDSSLAGLGGCPS